MLSNSAGNLSIDLQNLKESIFEEMNQNQTMQLTTKLLIIGFLILNNVHGQSQQRYSELINEAYNLYQNKLYFQSGLKYSEAFSSFGNQGYVNHRYNAACSWALANQPDSAFIQLFRIAEKGKYSDITHLTADAELNILHFDKRWEPLIKLVKENKEKAEANLDKALVANLDTIYNDDQKYRLMIDEIEYKYGKDSKEMNDHWDLIEEKDSINLIKIKKILDERGWLSTAIIGEQGNHALFLVIQHANLETQLKYLPMMREAVKNGNAFSGNLALLEDRVALRQGKKQLYGSQIGFDKATQVYYLRPLEDPDHVDIRRNEVGLGTIQDYISNWGLIWNIEAYKIKLPEIEAMERN